jgi:APA family basic amino acid/polyamine antiporter
MSIKPKLTFFDLSMIVVSFVIGVGIFKTPSIVAQKAGSPFIFFTAWILGGVISICGALTFAEIGSRFPTAGGFYKIFSYCYHPAYAFMLNWSLVIINAASAVAVALVGAEYINPVLLPADLQTKLALKLTAVSVILVLFALNYLGIKTGARTQNVLSLIKIILMAGFCLALFGNYQAQVKVPVATISEGHGFIMALGASLISVFFTYGGYQNTINLGADIQQPKKNMPRGIFAGMGIVITLYLILNFVYFKVLGFTNLQSSALPAADLAGAFFGSAGRKITSVAIFISVIGFINTSMMSNPRVYYAMAEDGILPQIFKRVNTKTMTQEFGLSFFIALTLVSLFVLDTFDRIVNYVMFIDSLSLVSAAATIFIFRKRAALEGLEEGHIFRIKWFPFVPIIFMIVLLVVTVNVVISDSTSALYGFIIFLAGYPLYWLLKKALART